MDEMTDGITEVLRAHYSKCHSCGWYHADKDIMADHIAYMAQRIVEALHLDQILVKESEVPPLYAIEGWIRGSIEEKP